MDRFKRNVIEKTLSDFTLPDGFFLTWRFGRDHLSIQIDRGDYHRRNIVSYDQLDSVVCGPAALITQCISDTCQSILAFEMADLSSSR